MCIRDRHRRTYIGALPGRVIQSIKKAGKNNPVFMLDEIDKLGSDYRGDPSSALLEVLDPEQNHAFSDHYLEVDFDLSNVMFIATANYQDAIPPALRDRMEILDFSGYIEDEKVQIAKRHILPKQIEENGLDKSQVTFDNSSIKELISSYTREAGVRNLEREVANVLRKVARDLVESKVEKVKVTKKQVGDYLGAPRFYSDIAEQATKPGVVTGLAWTAAGGDILFVESTLMTGKGHLTLTGQLGDVMKVKPLRNKIIKAYIIGNNRSFFKKQLKNILGNVNTIAIVGASSNTNRDSFKVMKYLIDRGYKVFPVNPYAPTIEILILYNIYNEILVNARDQIIRLQQCKSKNPVTIIKIEYIFVEITVCDSANE